MRALHGRPVLGVDWRERLLELPPGHIRIFCWFGLVRHLRIGHDLDRCIFLFAVRGGYLSLWFDVRELHGWPVLGVDWSERLRELPSRHVRGHYGLNCVHELHIGHDLGRRCDLVRHTMRGGHLPVRLGMH